MERQRNHDRSFSVSRQLCTTHGLCHRANALIGVPALFLGLALMIVCMIWTIVDTVQNTTVKK